MEPPPPPISGRFRLQVQIFRPQDAHNLNATPYRKFTIVKNPAFPLPDLTLQQLCDEIVNRFKAIYPNEQLFAVDKPQDSSGSDLYFGDRVRDIFVDNEIFRVIKGSSYRASVEPHRARSSSVQPNSYVGIRKRGHPDSRSFDGAQKRRRTSDIDPDQPMQSMERDAIESVRVLAKDKSQNAEIPDSRAVAVNKRQSPQINRVIQTRTSALNINIVDKVDDSLPGRQSSNPITKAAATIQNLNSPISVGSSFRDDFVTSGSDAQKATLGPRRQRIFLETDELYRGGSVSTTLTTPPSVAQQSVGHSPATDSTRLKRPSTGRNILNSETQRQTKPLPRVDIYDAIETDQEEANIKSMEQRISHNVAHLGVSMPKFNKLRSSKTPSSDRSGSALRVNASERQQENMEQQRRGRAEQVRLKEGQDKLAKQQFEVELQRPVREDSEERRITQEKDRGDRRANSYAERTVRGRRLQEEATSRREFQQDVNGKKDAGDIVDVDTDLAAVATAFQQTLSTEKPVERAVSSRDEMDVRKKNDESRNLKNQEHVQSRQENQVNLKEPKGSLKRSTPQSNGMLSRALAKYNSNLATKSTLEEHATSPAPITQPVSINKTTSCTPYIPRGRPSGLSPTISFHSQTVASSSPKVPSPNVGLEAQMPLPRLPSKNKRRVSFQDPPLSESRRSSSASRTMKQTTLVPPRLNIIDAKITPKHALPKGTTNGVSSSTSAKGKAKVVESPAKPPSPAIVISDDEGTNSDSTEGYRYVKAYDPSQAYQKSDTQYSSWQIKYEPLATDTISVGTSKRQNTPSQVSPETSTGSKSKSTAMDIPSPSSHTELASHKSIPRKISKLREPMQTYGSLQVVIPSTSNDKFRLPTHQGNKPDDKDTDSEYQDSGDDSEQESEKISKDEAQHIDEIDGEAEYLRQASKRKSNDAEHNLEADVDKSSEMRINGVNEIEESHPNDIEEGHQTEPGATMRGLEAQPNRLLDREELKSADAEEEYETDSDDVTDQSDSDDGESESKSESDTQAQLDNQLTQSSPSLPAIHQRTLGPSRGEISPKQDMEAEEFRPKMPSLSRQLQEIKHANQANQNATQVQTLANAQQMKDDTMQSSESDDSSDEGSTSEESTSSAENPTRAGGQERAKIRQELSSKIADISDTSSSPAVKRTITQHTTVPRKETRILPPPRQILPSKDKKIGFGKLARQFTTKKV